MPRPRLGRKIRFNPRITFFKPRGIPIRELQIIELSNEELEAMRLKNIEGFGVYRRDSAGKKVRF